MSRNYTLDTEAAKKSNIGGKRITTAGAYVGKITTAFYEKNPKGTEMVNLMFAADNGQEAGPIPLYTHDKDGKTLMGFDALNALMTCLKARELTALPAKVELYDYDSKAMVTKTKDTYPALQGKPVGLLLRQEEYTNRDGDTKERLTLAGSFDPATKMMASEILTKAVEPLALLRMTEWLNTNPVKFDKGSAPRRTGGGGSTAPMDDSPFPDDDIPFITCFGSF